MQPGGAGARAALRGRARPARQAHEMRCRLHRERTNHSGSARGCVLWGACTTADARCSTAHTAQRPATAQGNIGKNTRAHEPRRAAAPRSAAAPAPRRHTRASAPCGRRRHVRARGLRMPPRAALVLIGRTPRSRHGRIRKDCGADDQAASAAKESRRIHTKESPAQHRVCQHAHGMPHRAPCMLGARRTGRRAAMPQATRLPGTPALPPHPPPPPPLCTPARPRAPPAAAAARHPARGRQAGCILQQRRLAPRVSSSVGDVHMRTSTLCRMHVAEKVAHTHVGRRPRAPTRTRAPAATAGWPPQKQTGRAHRPPKATHTQMQSARERAGHLLVYSRNPKPRRRHTRLSATKAHTRARAPAPPGRLAAQQQQRPPAGGAPATPAAAAPFST